ncbi:hypothetical protein Y033_5654 [Burkholderia pseudomallei MSHR435]|nr:hypothetical protein DP42_5250 [Burkholderia pseudomallei]KGD54275.1 hypothetical protein DP49_4887 [Burkholderia pseudomallei]KGX79436.1 hypothetical protein Y033_5654 [Burkholderia pseudomallei MSHR435]
MIGARVPPRKSPPERGLFCARATARQRPRRSETIDYESDGALTSPYSAKRIARVDFECGRGVRRAPMPLFHLRIEQ